MVQLSVFTEPNSAPLVLLLYAHFCTSKMAPGETPTVSLIFTLQKPMVHLFSLLDAGNQLQAALPPSTVCFNILLLPLPHSLLYLLLTLIFDCYFFVRLSTQQPTVLDCVTEPLSTLSAKHGILKVVLAVIFIFVFTDSFTHTFTHTVPLLGCSLAIFGTVSL